MVARANKQPLNSPRRQRGAAAVLGAVTAILGLIAVGLAVDLARLYAAQRSLQRVANMAALDASRIAGGCFGRDARGPDALVTARDEARASLIRNGGDPSWIDSAGLVRLGRMRVDEAGIRQFDPLFDEDGAPLGAIAAHDAVQVVLLRPAPPRLIPGMSSSSDRREMVAVAAAMSRPVARFGVGSGLLGVDLSDSLLDPLLAQLLGSSPSLSLINYQNLLAAGLTLEALTGSLGGGDLGALLTETLPASDLVGAIADLVEMATADLGGGLGQLLGVDAGLVSVAGDLTISVGELASQALRQVNQGIPITINCPEVLTALGLNCSGGTVTILDPGTPGTAGVPDESGSSGSEPFASSGQVQVSLPSIDINPLGLGLASATASVDLTAARGVARLRDITCPRAGSPHPVVVLRPTTHAAVGELRLATELNLQRSRNLLEGVLGPLGGLLGGVLGGLLGGGNALLDVNIQLALVAPINLSSGSDTDDLTFILNDEHNRLTGDPSQAYPPNSDLRLAQALTSAVSNLQLDLSQTSVSIAGVPLDLAPANNLVNALLGGGGGALPSILNPLLGGLGSSLEGLLNPLLDGLGVEVGYADYRVFDVTDGQPVLFQR